MIGALLSVMASVAAVMAGTPPPAGALAIGVSTESQASFDSPYWQDLGIRRTRYFMACLRPAQPGLLPEDRAGARRRGARRLQPRRGVAVPEPAVLGA